MPRIAVKIKPDGFFGPEWIHFAITPATKPMMIVQIMCSTCSLLHVLRRRCRTRVHVGRESPSSRLTSQSVMRQEAGHGRYGGLLARPNCHKHWAQAARAQHAMARASSLVLSAPAPLRDILLRRQTAFGRILVHGCGQFP